jgi:FlaA1/EpsC-like NDP-sugar epimerase
VDILVTTFMVGLSGIVWRISTVINLGAVVYLGIAVGMALLISLINILLGLNNIQWTTASPTYVLDLGFSIGITCAVLWAINRFAFPDPWIPFSMFWLIGVMTFVGLVAVRYRERLFTGIANRWLLLRKTSVLIGERVLVVGAGELGEMALWLLHRSTYKDAFGVVGIVDDDPKKQGMCINGYRVLDETSKIPELVDKYDVGLIIFAISNIQARKLKEILEICRHTSAKVIEIPDLVKVFNNSLLEQSPIEEK